MSYCIQGALLVEGSLPSFPCHRPHSCAPFPSQAPRKDWTSRSPQQVSPGHSSPRVPRAAPPARGAHHGGCSPSRSLRGHVTAAIRAADCGLPPSPLAAVLHRRPAPLTLRPHHDRYARGPRRGRPHAGEAPGSSEAVAASGCRPRCGPSCAAERLLPPPASGRGRAGWGGRGARWAPRSPGSGLRTRQRRAPCVNTRLGPCSGLLAEPIFRPQGPGGARWKPASAPGGPRCHLLLGVWPWANVPQNWALGVTGPSEHLKL